MPYIDMHPEPQSQCHCLNIGRQADCPERLGLGLYIVGSLPYMFERTCMLQANYPHFLM